jgi:hypothetical protein
VEAVSACGGRPTGCGRREGAARRIVAAQALRTAPDGVVTIEVTADDDPQPGAGAAAGLLVELQGHALEDDNIVEADRALFLVAEDEVQIDGPEGDEGAGRVRRQTGELGVVVCDEVLAQVGVSGIDREDAGHAEFVDEPALQGAVEPLAAAAGLGGVATSRCEMDAEQPVFSRGRRWGSSWNRPP